MILLESWKEQKILRIVGDEAYSYHEAQMNLSVQASGQTIQNSNADSRDQRVMTAPPVPQDNNSPFKNQVNQGSGVGTASGKVFL